MVRETLTAESDIQPLAEQRDAVEFFRRDQGLRIDAYAGTGKTTTLRMLAESTSKLGLYLAFKLQHSDGGFDPLS